MRTAVTLTDGFVTLRPVGDADVGPLAAAIGDDRSISRWTRIPWPYFESHARDFVARAAQWWESGTDAPFAITDAATGEFLGGVGLHRIGGEAAPRSSYLPDEVGYWVAAPARGRGVATAALRLVSGWALADLGLAHLNLQTKAGNAASQRVARRAGYRYVGLVRASEVDDDTDDHDRYRLDLTDLAESADAADAAVPADER